MSYRLTNTLREDICYTLTKEKRKELADLSEALKQCEFDLAEAAYATMFKKPEEKKLFDSCPEKWFRKESYIRVAMGVSSDYLWCYFRKNDDKREFRPMPYDQDVILLPNDHEAVIAYRKARAAADAMRQELNTLQQKVNSTLRSFNSAKKLVEAWPEIEDVVQYHAPDGTTVTTVAFPREELNAELGLPKEQANA